MPIKDDLSVRMKSFYEEIPKTKLMRRTPVIIRIDGKAFHTFTRGFEKPFDDILIRTMQETTKYLCENIQGCVLGYTQSDEISLVLVDYQKFETSAWFDYEVQKMCSISASMATMAFNRFFTENTLDIRTVDAQSGVQSGAKKTLGAVYEAAVKKGAMFDARVFNIPKEEVTNCIYWRQLDASRNSIQMLGQAHFSHKELQHKSQNDIQDMLMLQKGINWNDLPVHKKRGTCVIKKYESETEKNPDTDGATETENTIMHARWFIDEDIPIFKGEGRDYIESLVMVGD